MSYNNTETNRNEQKTINTRTDKYKISKTHNTNVQKLKQLNNAK